MYASSEGEFDGLASKAIEPFGYEFETLAQDDAGWTFYFDVLYPTAPDWQRIMNRHVLENLTREGDDLSKPRRIFHWLYFSNETDRGHCAETARQRGFGIRLTAEIDKPNKSFPLALQLYRIDSVAPSAIDALTLELFSLAQANSGEYDGWETQVVKAGNEPTDDTPTD